MEGFITQGGKVRINKKGVPVFNALNNSMSKATKESVWVDATNEPQFNTWVIDTNSKEGHKLVGRYWHFGHVPFGIAQHMEGCHFAMFKTREIARKNLPSVKKSFPNAAVRKVRVVIIR
jgi:hypothetical protein